ncbi:MAG: hypothetical protein KUG80_00190 [Gammaproteobacteria bacterium]|nr:hypothetical protein [Gammaproteobacteria bacterium]
MFLLWYALHKSRHYYWLASLSALHGSGCTHLSQGFPCSRQGCFELVGWMSRVLRADKGGVIDESQALILKHLVLMKKAGLSSVTRFEHYSMLWQDR